MEEKVKNVHSGWIFLWIAIIAWLLIPALFYWGITHRSAPLIILAILEIPTAFLITWGLFALQPNEARVLVLFGKYVGTVRSDGFHWANPFTVYRPVEVTVKDDKIEKKITGMHYRISLRARNFQTGILKVNDLRGNPIEISAVVVWCVQDTAKALFDVDHYEQYVQIQSETAVRHLAGNYSYDHGDDSDEEGLTLRGNSDTINDALKQELQIRLDKAGVRVEEARLTHLAYAPEIAQAMLRRQQAEAIIAARKKIVHGAVSMVEMALSELSTKEIIQLDEERKAAMVGNLLVILCGESQAEPVINAGTLYH